MSSLAEDALSLVLARLRLEASIFLHGDFCGTWAVDTSGKRKMAFHLIEHGNAWLHMQEQPPRLLNGGELVVFPHDHRHILSSESDPPAPELVNRPQDPTQVGLVTTLVCGYFEFTGKAAWPLLDGLACAVVIDLKGDPDPGGTKTLLQLLIAELQRAAPATMVAVNHLASVLFIHVLRAEVDRGLDQGLLRAFADPKVGRALNLIHAEPGRDWNVERLAREVGLSRTAFADRFKQLTGFTPMRYVTEWRMQEAVDLLQNSEFSVAQIAERCGYGSEVSFRKAVRSVIGQTPGALRRLERDV